MANQLPPAPVQDDPGSYTWKDWYRILRLYLTQAGSLAWNLLDFSSSNITDIVRRSHTDLQNLNTTNYTHLTSTQATDLTDSGDSTLHYHASDRSRANHTGTQTASTISDFDTEVSNNTDVAANTAARHAAVTVSDTTTVNLTLVGQDISADVIPSGVDHGGLGGLTDDDHTQYLLASGTRALTADWDAGTFKITANQVASDVASGTAPFVCISNTLVSNLNSDLLDGQHGSYYLDSANFTGTNWSLLTSGSDNTLHYHATDRALSNATGTLAAANGGTGKSSYAIGDMIYASGTTTLSSIAAVATGNALISGGVGAAPTWGKIGLTTHVSGTLAQANGGTGQTTATAAFDALAPTTTQGDTIYFNGTDNVRLAKGTTYQSLNMNAGATAPEWQASLQSLMTTQGDIVYASAANTPARLAKGTASQILAMNAGATAPEWVTPSSGGINDGVVQSVTAAATTAINLASGDNIELTVDTNITALSFTNPGTVNLVYLILKNTDGGSYTITQPSSFNAGLTCPTSDDTGRIYSLYTEDAGVHWAVSFVGTIDVLKNVYGFGRNTTSYQLGALNTVDVHVGVQLFSNTFASISKTGGFATSSCFGITSTGALYGWGEGGAGEMGNSATTDQSSPVQIGSDKTWSKVSTARSSANNQHVHAITTSGQLWAWGNDASGNLGDGTTVNKSSPVQIGALTDWAQISSGYFGCAAVKTDGTLWTWGDGSTYGALGDGTTISKSSPVQVGALTDWAYVRCQNWGAFGVKTNGTLWAWGSGANGVLGDGTTINKSSPVQIGALTDWTQNIAAGANNHAIAVKSDGTLWAWGNGNVGQLGDGTTVSKSSPVQIGALTTWAKVAVICTGSAGTVGSFALKTDQTIWGWGQLASFGFGTVSSPVQIGTALSWNDITGVAPSGTEELIGVVALG